MTAQGLLNSLKGLGRLFPLTRNPARTLLFAILVLITIIVAARFLLSWHHEYSMDIQNRIDTKMIRYESLNRLLADAEKYRQEHSALSDFKKDYLDSRLIHASTPVLAETQLQNLVNNMVKESNLNVLSMRMHPRTHQGEIINLRMGINSRGEIGAIYNFLRSASSHDKFIFVDQVEIRILNHRERRLYNFNAQIVAWTESP